MNRMQQSNGRASMRRGAALILVVLAAGIAFVMGVTFLTNVTTTTGMARLVNEHAQARQIAASGIDLALRSVDETEDWRQTRSPGAWIDEMSLLDGTVTTTAEFTPHAGPELVFIDDASFEQEIAELPTPLVDPPMSGAIGGWQVERDAAVISGPTVPRIGVVASPEATEGIAHAFIRFDTAILGSATFGQTLPGILEPRRSYSLKVDIALTALLPLDDRYGFRVLAGSTVIASSETAVTLEELPSEPDAEAWIEYVPSGEVFLEHTLHFLTDDDPPSGQIRIELFAESSGLVMEIRFDNVRLEMRSNEPLLLTATGRRGDASHVTTARIVEALDGSAQIVEWGEP